MKRTSLNTKGMTLIEIMVASVIFAISALAIIGAIGKMGLSVNFSRETTLASNLAQEKMERVKSAGFYNVIVTSAVAYDTNFSPMLEYDSAYFVPETIFRAGIEFTRRVLVEKLDDDASNNLLNMGYPHPDTGLKRVTVHVVWEKNNVWKKSVVSSLVNNPDRVALDKRMYGTVTDCTTGLPLEGAEVAARRNPGWVSYTDNTGAYSFNCTGNTMRMRAQKHGYYLIGALPPGGNLTLPAYPNNQVQYDFCMTAISSRTVYGYALQNQQLVISQVVPEWKEFDTDPWHDLEYVELYNPATYFMTITAADLKLKFVNASDTVVTSTLTFINTTVPSYGYFLIVGSTDPANNQTPNGVLADATYYIQPDTQPDNHIQNETQGGIIITDGLDNVIDKVGWGSPANPAPASAVYGTGIDLPALSIGSNHDLGDGETIFRKCLATSTIANMSNRAWSGDHMAHGNAWNSWNNNADFVGEGNVNAPIPRNSLVTNTPAGGTISPGAYVYANDDVSPTVIASTAGFYSMDVAVGDWTLTASSSTRIGTKEISVLASGTSYYHNVITTATTDMGYITGYTLKISAFPVGNILVQADPGGYQTRSYTSGDVGRYFISVPGNEMYVMTANPNFDNPTYNLATSTTQISVSPGVLYEHQDLKVWRNGFVSGRVAAPDGTGLPNIVVVAAGMYSNGNTAVTDGNGDYLIVGLRLIGNPYNIYPSIQADQTCSPNNYSVSVSLGQTKANKNFTVTGAYINITGTVIDQGVNIDTGVMVMASTTTISATSPPAINYSVRSGAVGYFQTYTDPNGNYNLNVPGGKTYNLVAWYTSENGTTSSKTAVVAAPATGSIIQNFSWP